MTHHYGYIPDLPDHRDKKFAIAERLTLPTSVDLRDLCPPVEDQGQLGSCTSFAGGAAIRVARKIQGLAEFTTSHLFLYYNSRSKNTKSVDAGATIRDTIKSAAKIGDCRTIPNLGSRFDGISNCCTCIHRLCVLRSAVVVEEKMRGCEFS